MDAILNILEQLKNPQIIAIALFVMEMLMRVIKTEKPWSIMHLIKRVLRSASQICGAIADFMDKILPQQVIPPSLPPQ